MTIQLEAFPSVLFHTPALQVKLATTFAEIEAALRLRFEVFNLEMQEGLLSSYDYGYDTDAYDAYCDHLIVKDLTTNKVVGTYRLLRQSVAEKNIGFYSENEFDLSNLKQLPGELLELGRSCVAHSHRSGYIIARLWDAIIAYAQQRKIKYLFGCGSFHQTELSEILPLYSYLSAHYLAPKKYRVTPVPNCKLNVNENDLLVGLSRDVLRTLSPVMKGYLRAGAMICGAPAYDADFGTIDVLVLMDMQRMTRRYRHHFSTLSGKELE